MSYKSREKKRRKQIAMGNVRVKHGEAMRSRHYLTVCSRDCCCNNCGAVLRSARRDDVVYRHTPREVVCLSCATKNGIDYRTSRKWDRTKRAK